MQKNVSVQMEEIVEIPNWAEAYPENKFTVFKCCFLSTKPNSHGIPITDKVLREYGKTILGNFLVAKIEGFDATTHRKDESIMGYFPIEQEVEFVEEDGVTKAYAYAVVSKKYAEQFNGIFEFDNFRNTSVEMMVGYTDETEEEVECLDVFALTCLGRSVNGSCPDANMKMVRFSQKKAEEYFKKNDTLTTLKQFVQERKQSMAEKTYKIDKSKEAMSDTPWGDVDKADLRDKIMEASNKPELVKACYMLVEDGWDDAPSEHLKYPVMEIKGDTLVYNRYGLSSALAYAKQEDEIAVIDRVEKIYKELDLDDSEGKEEKKMSEIEFSAVNIGDLWGLLWNAIRKHDAWDYSVMGIYEEDNQKFAILEDREQKLYRLNFSLTEEGLVVAEEVVEVKQEFTETDNMKKFTEPENVADYRFAKTEGDVEDDKTDEDDGDEDDEEEHKDEEEMSCDKLMARIEQMQKDIDERDHIIMDKDAELFELRAFKEAVDTKEKAMSVERIMAECKDCLSEEQFKQFREDGLACEMSAIDGWANGVKAVAFSQMKKTAKKNEAGVFTFGAPAHADNAPKNVWERLKNKY